MSFPRTALFALLIGGAAFASDGTTETYQSETFGIGTAAPWGAGAFAGVLAERGAAELRWQVPQPQARRDSETRTRSPSMPTERGSRDPDYPSIEK
jgi:hypothetical protein